MKIGFFFTGLKFLSDWSRASEWRILLLQHNFFAQIAEGPQLFLYLKTIKVYLKMSFYEVLHKVQKITETHLQE
jgi:hypothetical protein